MEKQTVYCCQSGWWSYEDTCSYSLYVRWINLYEMFQNEWFHRLFN